MKNILIHNVNNGGKSRSMNCTLALGVRGVNVVHVVCLKILLRECKSYNLTEIRRVPFPFMSCDMVQ